ncbi:hypothetical protein BDR07DRAFT_1479683 [Suillus spraguei]|nr:hypothetical protein BDR07DRAFT_1479683 [Suillus spraguei]
MAASGVTTTAGASMAPVLSAPGKSAMSEAFSKLFYENTIKPTLDIAFKEAKEEAEVKAAARNTDIKVPHRIGIIRKQTSILYNLASDGTKQQIAEFVKETKKKKQRSLKRLTGLWYLIIKSDVLTEFFEELQRVTGYVFTVLIGGPTPAMGGKIDMQSFHIGAVEVGNQFDQAYLMFNSGIMRPWKEFAKCVFLVAAAKGGSVCTVEPESMSLANGMSCNTSTALDTPAPYLLDIHDDEEDLMLDHLISMHLNNCALPEPILLLPPPLLPSQSLPSTLTSTSKSQVDPESDSWMSSPEFLDGFEKFLETCEPPSAIPILQPPSPVLALTRNFTADFDVPEQPQVIATKNNTPNEVSFQDIIPPNDVPVALTRNFTADFDVPEQPPVIATQNNTSNDVSFQVVIPPNNTPVEMQMQQPPTTMDNIDAMQNDDPAITIPLLQYTTSAEDTPIETLPNLKVLLSGHSSDTLNSDGIPQTDHNTESLAVGHGKCV